DGARRDADGYFWVMGRIDDVVNVAGHRLGTMEVESALVSHAAVAEAAVVGRPDELKGQAITAFVTLESSRRPSDELKRALREHVGHARFLVVADVLVRYLLARGLGVTFVRNITDIDDKMIRRAAEEGLTVPELAEREIAAFNDDVRRLGCLPPTHEPRATAHIPPMIALVEQLGAKGLAYPTPDGSVYFRVRRFPAYGKLSHRRLDDLEVGEEIDAAKEDPHDFALWKGAKPGEPTWPSPWGPGRPGWHLERAAMSAHHLG